MQARFEKARQALIELGPALRAEYGAFMYGMEGDDNPSNILDQVLGRLNHVEGAAVGVDRIHRIVTDAEHDRDDLIRVAFSAGIIDDPDTTGLSDAALRALIVEHYS